MPPVPKKADGPNDRRPVYPNRISKPRPNSPQIRMRLMVFGVKPRCGRTNGTAISAIAVRISTSSGCFLTIGRSFAAGRAEQSVRTQHEHQRHGDEQHDVGITWVEYRGDADDLASDQASED